MDNLHIQGFASAVTTAKKGDMDFLNLDPYKGIFV